MSDVQTGTGSHSENKFEEYYEGMLKMSALTTRLSLCIPTIHPQLTDLLISSR